MGYGCCMEFNMGLKTITDQTTTLLREALKKEKKEIVWSDMQVLIF
jgi:hypothetical protein